WNAHNAAKNTNTAHIGMRTRCQRQATRSTSAIATTRNAPGLYENAALSCPCTSAVTPRVIPQNGHGTPVTVRSGHGGPIVAGSQGRTAATANMPAPATRNGLRSIVSDDDLPAGVGAGGAAVRGVGAVAVLTTGERSSRARRSSSGPSSPRRLPRGSSPDANRPAGPRPYA